MCRHVGPSINSKESCWTRSMLMMLWLLLSSLLEVYPPFLYCYGLCVLYLLVVLPYVNSGCLSSCKMSFRSSLFGN